MVLQPLIVHSLQSGIQDNVTFDIGTCSFCSIKRKWDKFCNFWLAFDSQNIFTEDDVSSLHSFHQHLTYNPV